jgi:hypothetical protein
MSAICEKCGKMCVINNDEYGTSYEGRIYVINHQYHRGFKAFFNNINVMTPGGRLSFVCNSFGDCNECIRASIKKGDYDHCLPREL